MEKQNYPILYAAYGANTNRDHMKHRCPTAKYVGNCTLHEFALAFRGVADVVDSPRNGVLCALWEITQRDEQALDVFEGYPRGYTKRYARIQFRGKSRVVMFYVMAGKRLDFYEPPQSYEHTLREGYKSCNMSTKQIDRAIVAAKRSSARRKTYRGSWVQKDIAANNAKRAPSHYLSQQRVWEGDDGPVEYPYWMQDNFDTSNLPE